MALDLTAGVADEIYSAPPGAFDINRENEEFQLLAFFNTLRWSGDSRFLYFLEPQAGRNFLMKYDLQAKKKTAVLKENTFLFEPFGDGMALAVFKRGGLYAVVAGPGDKQGAAIPLPSAPLSSRSLKVSPDGARAVFLVPVSDNAIYPLVIDLKSKAVSMLVAGGPDEQIAAGDFFAKQKMHALAAGFYEKAGPAGMAPLFRTYHLLQDSAAGAQVYRQLLDSYKTEGRDAHLNLAEKLRSVPDMYDIAKREYMLAEEKNLGRALLRAATLAYRLKKPEWPDLYRKSVEYYRRRSCNRDFRGGCPGTESVTWLLHLAARCTGLKSEPCETEYTIALADHLKPELFKSLAEKPPDRPAQNMFEMPFALVALYETLNRCDAAAKEYQDMLAAIEKLPVDKQKQYAGPAADAAGRLKKVESRCPALKKKGK